MPVKNQHSGIREIGLSEIRPNPLNPRKRFEGPDFDQFCENIARIGVLQPILVRSITEMDESGIAYEIVFGGRRYAACVKNAQKNGGVNRATIPVQIRNLSDDDALDLMTVENLQREDLTPWEEAQGFKIYVDRFGDEKIPDLAERVNMDPRYIRRRLALLALPDEVLKAWDAGDIQTGHLHQLLRLEDKREIRKLVQDIVEHNVSVGELKREIDNDAPPLSWAKFDMAAVGCPACNRNSDIQKKLFDIDCKEKSKCLFPNCFKQNQNNWFLKNWKKTGFYKRYHTTGFRFKDDVGYGKHHDFYDPEAETCHSCQSYVTLLDLDGTSKYYQRVCLGDRKCFDEVVRSGKQRQASERKKTADTKADPSVPRVSWHGTYFREKFFQAELPQRIEQLTVEESDDLALLKPIDGCSDDGAGTLKADRLVILNLIKSNRDLSTWFALRHKLADKKEVDSYGVFLHPEHIFSVLLKIEDPMQLRRELRAAAAQGIITDEFTESTRRLVAAHIGIDLTKEWSITEEYLQKKTKAEMLEMGETLGIFADEKAQVYLFETLGKKRGKFSACKAGELRDVFLKSGVELNGRVPAEILAGSAGGNLDQAEDEAGELVDAIECPDCGASLPGYAGECDQCGTAFS